MSHETSDKHKLNPTKIIPRQSLVGEMSEDALMLLSYIDERFDRFLEEKFPTRSAVYGKENVSLSELIDKLTCLLAKCENSPVKSDILGKSYMSLTQLAKKIETLTSSTTTDALTDADWSGDKPVDVVEAINRISDRLVNGGTGPL